MFKRFVLLLIVVQLVVLGGVPAGAQKAGRTEDEVILQKENQQMDVIVEQKQRMDIGDESKIVIQDQNITGIQDQKYLLQRKTTHRPGPILFH